jgi:hypothetical protein
MTYQAYTPAESEKTEIGDLAGEKFPNHPKVGPWFTLQGTACEPWEVGLFESNSENNSRPQSTTKSPEWDSTIIVQTPTTKAEPVGGGGSLDLPNHGG